MSTPKQKKQIENLKDKLTRKARDTAAKVKRFAASVNDDVSAVRERDPAAKSNAEVLLLYSSVHALIAHRIAHSLYLKEKYFLARKKPKLYMTGVLEVTVRSITTEGEQKLYLDTADAEMMKGKRILIVDDVISTGESLRAIEELVNAAGGNICGKLTILAEGDAQDRDDIGYLNKLPLFAHDGNGNFSPIGNGDGEIV